MPSRTEFTPEQSFAIIEHHLNLLRTKGFPAHTSAQVPPSRPIEDVKPKLEPGEPSSDPPGRLIAPDQGGFYTGATSISAHLVVCVVIWPLMHLHMHIRMKPRLTFSIARYPAERTE
jgi:hypothetical protein